MTQASAPVRQTFAVQRLDILTCGVYNHGYVTAS